MTTLDELARRRGVSLQHYGPDGRLLTVSDETKLSILAALGIRAGSEREIAESLLEANGLEPPVMRAAEGHRCYLPQWLREARAWGISVQVFELASRRNWGIGDFADLGQFCEIAASVGADFVGVNPLHALFVSQPARRSPFFPSSRLFLNPLYIAVDRLPGYSASTGELEAIQRLRDAALIDYDGVARLKLNALRRVWLNWRDQPSLFSEEDFERFRLEGGEALHRHAMFEALSLAMVALGYGGGWTDWPHEFRSVTAPEVAEFAARNDDEIRFHIWLQWLADAQLAQAAAAAEAAGMRIGLYLDLAVGDAPDGSATWSNPDQSVAGISIGAPPDFFTADGQDWGLSPLSPAALPNADFAHYRRMIEAAMRHAGALRIDHAMSLWQLFFVPQNGVPADGAYVRYPIEGMLKVLAELSAKHRAIVIGEDLGYVPEGFRWVMELSGILSYRILYFEERDGRFVSADDYPRLALACLSTHDLPTLKGWWIGNDIGLRLEHGLIGAEEALRQAAERGERRAQLVRALRASHSLSDDDLPEVEAALRDPASELPASLMAAAHRYVARTPSLLAAVRLADLAGDLQPANLPGTVDSYPNWRLKSSLAIEDLAGISLFRSITVAMAQERPRA